MAGAAERSEVARLVCAFGCLDERHDVVHMLGQPATDSAERVLRAQGSAYLLPLPAAAYPRSIGRLGPCHPRYVRIRPSLGRVLLASWPARRHDGGAAVGSAEVRCGGWHGQPLAISCNARASRFTSSARSVSAPASAINAPAIASRSSTGSAVPSAPALPSSAAMASSR